MNEISRLNGIVRKESGRVRFKEFDGVATDVEHEVS